MRITISLFVFCCSLCSFSQRMTFEDPGLTFSLKKPKHWVMVDDGYEIKYSPLMRDTAYTYLTLTYFEHPQPISNDEGSFVTQLTIESDNKEAFKHHIWSDRHMKIANKKVKWKRSVITKDDILIEKRFYDFDLDKKNWEIVVAAPCDDFKKYFRQFKRIINSFRLEPEVPD